MPIPHRRRPSVPFLVCGLVFLALATRQPAMFGVGLVFLALALAPLWQGRGE